MSTQFTSRCSCLFITLFIVSSPFAQVSEFTLHQPIPVTGHTVKVYENVQTEFTKVFPKVTNVEWSKLKKNYLAKFSMDGQKYSVLFTPRADIVYQITYGKVNNLPADVRKAIKRMYVEFEIPTVIKVEEAGRTIWSVVVEDETNFAWVRVENDEIEEVRKFTKGTPHAGPQPGMAKH